MQLLIREGIAAIPVCLFSLNGGQALDKEEGRGSRRSKNKQINQLKIKIIVREVNSFAETVKIYKDKKNHNNKEIKEEEGRPE